LINGPEPEYHGEYYDFEGFVIDPCAVQEAVPLWVGGRTLRSLRRAAALADGWCPFSSCTFKNQTLSEYLETLEALATVHAAMSA
jgi:alkanesulfonate monooxygenase SsuD/methylene tetrahydromethanopterin reductase-like flavin-dependent oxidoreductase (luciferase family)